MAYSISSAPFTDWALVSRGVPTGEPLGEPLIDNTQADVYEGNGATPSPTNLLYSLYEIRDATTALGNAVRTKDQEGCLDAFLRLLQQPFSLINGAGSFLIQAVQIAAFSHVIKIDHFIMPFSQLAQSIAPAVNALGIALCVMELGIESLGLYRTVTFHKIFCHRNLIDKIQNIPPETPSRVFKGMVQNWAQEMLKHLGGPTFPQKDTATEIQGSLEELLSGLENHYDLSNVEDREAVQETIRKICDEFINCNLQQIHYYFLEIPESQKAKIQQVAHSKFLRGALIHTEQEERVNLSRQYLHRKKNELARRVQPWLANELSSKLPALIRTLSNPHADPLEIENAKKEALDLLVSMDIQCQKKETAHILGVIAVTAFLLGLVLTLVACPYIIPILLVTFGGWIALSRRYFYISCKDNKGWEFKLYPCLPLWMRLLHQKISEAAKKNTVPTPDYHSMLQKRRVYPLNYSYSPRRSPSPLFV